MAEEILWKVQFLELQWPRDLDLESGHMTHYHESLIDLHVYTKLHWKRTNFLWMDVRTDISTSNVIRSTRRSRPKNGSGDQTMPIWKSIILRQILDIVYLSAKFDDCGFSHSRDIYDWGGNGHFPDNHFPVQDVSRTSACRKQKIGWFRVVYRSFKNTGNSTIRQSAYEFLVALYSKDVPVLHVYEIQRDFGWKLPTLTYPTCIWHPQWGVTPFEFHQ